MFKTRRVGLLGALALLLVIALFAFAVACKDDKKKDDRDTPDTGDTPSAEETADGGDGGGDGGDEGDGADGDGLSDLERLAGDFEAITGSVTYSFTTEDASGSTTESEWTIIQRPPDYRYEFGDPSNPDAGKSIIIATGGDTYICTDLPAGDDLCFKSAGSQDTTAPLSSFFGAPELVLGAASSADGVDVEQRTIAGIDANCYTVSADVAGEGNTYEACFSDDGLFLFSQTVSGGISSTIEATAASSDVSDADFEPPFPVTEIPGT
ncbi:MAG: hypothetical protein WD379_03055 [Dehalococcoidia bacterium]